MEPHIDVITLAVGDLDRSLVFYRDGLGLETTGVVASEFFDESAAGSTSLRLPAGLKEVVDPIEGERAVDLLTADLERGLGVEVEQIEQQSDLRG
jgi:catechol 2,3-dioxygenase-like lactoylglutathione lyase family enzyme